MIGEMYISSIDFYDVRSKTTRKKARPVLVVGGPRNNDYTVLPVSTISNRQMVDPDYDILIGPAERSILNLDRECFVRAHKQTTVHQAQLIRKIGDMRSDLPDFYIYVIEKMEQHQNEIIDHAF